MGTNNFEEQQAGLADNLIGDDAPGDGAEMDSLKAGADVAVTTNTIDSSPEPVSSIDLEALESYSKDVESSMADDKLEEPVAPQTSVDPAVEAEPIASAQSEEQTPPVQGEPAVAPAAEVTPPVAAAQPDSGLVEALRAQINQLASEVQSLRSQPQTGVPGVQPPAFQPKEFVTAENMNEVFNSPEGINQLLNSVAQHAAEHKSEREEQERSVKLEAQIADAVSLHMETRLFWERYPQLEPFRPAVALVAQEISAKNPEFGYKEVYEILGEETIKRLGLQAGIPVDQPAPVAQTPATPARRVTPPIAARTGGARVPATAAPKTSVLDSVITGILNADD
jgi:hypothetical protein